MKRLLLLLVPPLLVVAARMHVEWAWFAQFNWQSILFQRWMLQLLFAGVAALPILISVLWLKAFNRADQPPLKPTRPIAGMRYSLLLLICGLAFLSTAVVITDLAVLAWKQPFSLGHWQNAVPIMGSMWKALLPIQIAVAGVSMCRPHWRRWLAAAMGVAFVVVVSRAWGIWSLAWLIPDEGLREPLLGTDLSFGLGRFTALRFGLELLVLMGTFTTTHALWGRMTEPPHLSDWSMPALGHRSHRLLSTWIGINLLGVSSLVWLSRHQLLWHQHGLVAGAGWLQHHLTLPFRSLIAILLMVVAVSCILKRLGRLQGVLVLSVAAILVIEGTITPLTRWLVVRPQELSLQAPYLETAIRSTRHGFQLDRIQRRKNEPNADLTAEDLEAGASTLRNVRLWDSGPLLETNRQLQQLRVYYRFSNAAVDRYPLIPDSDTSQQVIISARELDQSALPRRSKTWQNRHFVFTHGNGFTVSPVNTRGADGLPSYVISDLGSKARIEGNRDLGIKRSDVKKAIPAQNAALYFGILPSPYAVVPTEVDEFDYPDGDLNVYTHYEGSAGIPIGSLGQRLAAAIYLAEPRLLTTQAIQNNSHVLLRREVRQRIRAVAPFLDLRGEPYLVSVPGDNKALGINAGRSQHQFWIVEGYTHSSTYPYSASVSKTDSDRYLRNSVKIIVDAYNGSMRFFVSEPNDPLIQAWQKLFPQLFHSMESMPKLLKSHLRVPEDFFKVQVSQLQRYHVEDPRIFYSGDDVWQVPLEVYGGKQISVEPYHITAQIQGNNSSEFLLLQPLTPLARPNLTAWLAARNDGSHYGELLLIDFPKDRPILGPEQIQALINQDPEVSKVFSLWDGGGSELVQGNLLVLPVGTSLLYVEPVYLRATKGGLPSLVRIVVSDGRAIAMDVSLSGAIERLMKKAPTALLQGL
jgi:uncharacterized membrane protein (UPF0182 family)